MEDRTARALSIMPEHVILVDERDRATGVAEKMLAHRDGLLHRAFSVFLFNRRGELLLQQRAMRKYHSGGLWTNTCCSHPRPGETIAAAVARRLAEEMGITCSTRKAFDFVYRVQLAEGVIEHELDHVYIGEYDGKVAPDPSEVKAYRWIDLSTLKQELAEHPQHFTVWFKLAIDRALHFALREGVIGH